MNQSVVKISDSFRRILKQVRLLDFSDSSMEFQALAPEKWMLNLS